MKKKILAALAVALAGFAFGLPQVRAANFTVDCFDDAPDTDPDDGVCASAGPCSSGTGLCTLRAAIQTANSLNVPGADVITLPAGTYTIQTSPCDDTDGIGNIGDFDITSFVTINGAGAQNTIIDGNGMDRVFEVRSPEPFDASATLSGMTIRNGLAAQCQEFLEDGGGILVRDSAALNLDGVAVTENTAANGGGIFNSGTLSIIDSEISGNDAVGFTEGDFSFGGDGGGIYSDAFSLTFTEIQPRLVATDTFPIVNTTISGNTAREFGGGIAIAEGTIGLRNVTITDNEANISGSGSAAGGGIALLPVPQVPQLTLGGTRGEPGEVEALVRNTIIAGNIDHSSEDAAPDCLASSIDVSLTSEGFNLIGDDSNCGGAFIDGTNGDQVGVDPVLGALADNGGPTRTHALLTGSPAIDLANLAGCFANDANNGSALTADQRGLTRPADGNDDDNIRCDIGAFEVQPLCGNGALDGDEECDDGNVSAGDGCAADCTLEPACGDSAVDEGEECDDGNATDGDGCEADCTFSPPPPTCGNGTVDPGEECDGGADCLSNCSFAPFCGDGSKGANEDCDDGNNVDGDGCSAACIDESTIGFLLGSGIGCNLSTDGGASPRGVAGLAGFGLAAAASLLFFRSRKRLLE